MAREIKENQKYKDRLLKLIPSEIVAAYLVLSGIIPEGSARWGTPIVSIVLLVLVPFYLWRMHDVRRTSQLIITMISFVVWVYSLRGSFRGLGIVSAVDRFCHFGVVDTGDSARGQPKATTGHTVVGLGSNLYFWQISF